MPQYQFWILSGCIVLVGLASDRNYRKLVRIEDEVENLRKSLCPTNYDKMMKLEEIAPGASVGSQVERDWLSEVDTKLGKKNS